MLITAGGQVPGDQPAVDHAKTPADARKIGC
jgi:hypothetical protein